MTVCIVDEEITSISNFRNADYQAKLPQHLPRYIYM